MLLEQHTATIGTAKFGYTVAVHMSNRNPTQEEAQYYTLILMLRKGGKSEAKHSQHSQTVMSSFICIQPADTMRSGAMFASSKKAQSRFIIRASARVMVSPVLRLPNLQSARNHRLFHRKVYVNQHPSPFQFGQKSAKTPNEQLKKYIPHFPLV